MIRFANMRKFLIASISVLFLATSCTTKFNVGADYKEVTVVYGLLSLADTAHYIKITKGYFDQKQNNLELAKNPDSLYFNNLAVSMQVLNNGNVVETITLNRVDLVTEGYIKDAGTFASSPNYAYKFKKNLDASKTYRLRVTNLTSGKEITGETSVIGASPSSFRFIQPSDNTEELTFSDPLNPYQFIWRGPAAAVFYDVVVKFKYQEVNMITAETTYVVKDVPVIMNVLSTGSELSATLSSVDFFKQLNSAVGDGSLTIKRYIDTPGLQILAGGQELKTYIDVNSAQGGITYDQIKPNYTNLVGENVFGIFSTRGQIEFSSIKFSAATIDSIKNGMYTKSLRILGDSDK